jgi:hypothetical protein
MVRMLDTSRGLYEPCFWHWGTASLAFHQCPEAALWELIPLACVCVMIYERSMTDHIRRIYHVVEATTPRWTFEGGMREAAREALALLRHEAEEQMEQSQYRHFPSYAREGAEVVVMLAGDRDHIGCFTDQVKLTRALV